MPVDVAIALIVNHIKLLMCSLLFLWIFNFFIVFGIIASIVRTTEASYASNSTMTAQSTTKDIIINTNGQPQLESNKHSIAVVTQRGKRKFELNKQNNIKKSNNKQYFKNISQNKHFFPTAEVWVVRC